ncbi:MAG: preprotein translocase subunit YajC [Opitutaceae bacterium]
MLSLVSQLPFAQQTAPAPAGPSQGGFVMIVFWGLFIAAMWFLLIAPQRKKQKEQQKMISALAAGDEILLTGGIYGEITSVRPDRLIVRIGDNTKVEVEKGFIHSVVRKSGEAAGEKK